MAAMRDELKRSMAELRLKDEPAPYYIDYEIDDVSTTARHREARGAAGRHGEPQPHALRGRARRRLRVRQLAVRHPGTGRWRRRRQRVGDARRRLRRDAPANLAGDRCRLQARRQRVRQKEGGVPESRRRRRDSRSVAGSAGGDRAARVRGVFGAAHAGSSGRNSCRRCLPSSPAIESSDVWAIETRGTRYYVNSEGFTTLMPIQLATAARHRRVAGRRQHDGARRLQPGREPAGGHAARCRCSPRAPAAWSST